MARVYQRWFIILGLLFLSWGASALSASPSAIDELLLQADDHYQMGECEKAVPLYEEYLSKVGAAPEGLLEKKQEASFKLSYCHLHLGHDQQATDGFKQFVAANPENDEARSRLAIALFNLSQFEDVRFHASRVQSPEFAREMTVYVARSFIETKNYGDAIRVLRSVKQPDRWSPVYLYWEGQAHYRLGSFADARKLWTRARESSPNGLWVKQASQIALERLNRFLKPIRGELSLGMFSDSNVPQTGSDVLSPGAAQASSEASKADVGTHLSGQFAWVPLVRPWANFSARINASSPFHSEYSDFNFSTLGAEVVGRYEVRDQIWTSLSVQHLWTYYNQISYRQFALLNPSLSWTLNKSWTLQFDLPASFGTNPVASRAFAPSLFANYVFSERLFLRGGLSFSTEQGDRATYVDSGGVSVVDGSMFSNFFSLGTFVGASYSFTEQWSINSQVNLTQTNFEKEDLPSSSADSANEARVDRLIQFQLDAAYKINQDWMVSAGSTFSKNDSSGFQGLESGGITPSYSYDRFYFLLRTNFSY
jgi:tetratricopeptide (TPR) repeat protein